MKRNKLLFFNPGMFTEMQGAALCINPPVDRRVVIDRDKPWETGMIGYYSTILRVGGVYKLYYSCRDSAGKASLAYAESEDGVNFVKPSLGVFEYQGSKVNNLLGISPVEGNVQWEPDAPEDERFKYLVHHGRLGMFLYTSPDGIHWKKHPSSLMEFFCDSQNICFFDPRYGKYILYLRGYNLDPNARYGERKRKVVRYEMDDLKTAQEFLFDENTVRHGFDGIDQPLIIDQMPTALAADEYDGRDTDIYTLEAAPYEGYYVGFPSYYRHLPYPQLGGEYVNDGMLEVLFTGSEDGVRWHKYDRVPYLRNEIAGRFQNKMSMMGHGIIRDNGHLRQYGAIFNTRHGEVDIRNRDSDGTILMYDQRLDGFVCASFPYDGGSFTTKAWEISGGRLTVNADTGVNGRLLFALKTETGEEIEGFRFEDCTPVEANHTAWEVVWGGRRLPERQSVCVSVRGNASRLFSMSWGCAGDTV